MLTRLPQVGALRRAVDRNFALFATALGADAFMKSETEAFFLANIADRTAQAKHLGARRDGRENLLLWHLGVSEVSGTRMDVDFPSAPVEKTA
jgi:hypothetical protein